MANNSEETFVVTRKGYIRPEGRQELKENFSQDPLNLWVEESEVGIALVTDYGFRISVPAELKPYILWTQGDIVSLD